MTDSADAASHCSLDSFYLTLDEIDIGGLPSSAEDGHCLGGPSNAIMQGVHTEAAGAMLQPAHAPSQVSASLRLSSSRIVRRFV